jgi:putative ABC transport system ATP-binding protein
MKNQFTLKNVTKVYEDSTGGITALKDANIVFKAGEFVSIVGKSGSGKSTLLNMISCIDRPTSGSIHFGDLPLYQMKESELTRFRGKNIGIVFQFFQLIPTLTVLENIMLPMDFNNTYPVKERKKAALKILEIVNIAEYADKLPVDLSGGQQQRVAIARALANNPHFIIADEPTGNLDSQNADSIISLFRSLSKEGIAVIMVTHNKELAECTDRVITICDGNILSDVRKVG